MSLTGSVSDYIVCASTRGRFRKGKPTWNRLCRYETRRITCGFLGPRSIGFSNAIISGLFTSSVVSDFGEPISRRLLNRSGGIFDDRQTRLGI